MTYEVRNTHPASSAVIANAGMDSMQYSGFSTVGNLMSQPACALNALGVEHPIQSDADNNDSLGNNANDMTDTNASPRSICNNGRASRYACFIAGRAGSELSIGEIDEKGPWGSICGQDLELVAKVLAARCSLLEAQSEIGILNLNADYARIDNKFGTKQADHSNSMESDDEQQLWSLSRRIGNISLNTSQYLNRNTKSFAKQHRQRLCSSPSKNTISKPQEDFTVALPDTLQDVLVFARVSDLEQGQDVCASTPVGFADATDSLRYEHDVLGNKSMTLSARDGKFTQAAALRKELSLISSELTEVKKALASLRTDTHRYLRKPTRRTLAEEMYCKETVQRLIQQMQAEIEQWSQIQDIVVKLQEEIDGLSHTQRFWEGQARRMEEQLLSLGEELHDWKCWAQTAQEELVMLRCERQILKSRVEMMEDAQMCMSCVAKRAEESTCENAGPKGEEFGAYESFVHSRNESSRSSVDLGTFSQRSFLKSIKKPLNFDSNKENINTNKVRSGNLGGAIRSKPLNSKLSDKKTDVGSKGKVNDSQPFAGFVNIPTTNPDIPDLLHCHHERKKARIFGFKSKLARNVNGSNSSFKSEITRGGLPDGHESAETQDHIDVLWTTIGTLKHKMSPHCVPPSTPLPSAPASTPSREILGNNASVSNNATIRELPMPYIYEYSNARLTD